MEEQDNQQQTGTLRISSDSYTANVESNQIGEGTLRINSVVSPAKVEVEELSDTSTLVISSADYAPDLKVDTTIPEGTLKISSSSSKNSIEVTPPEESNTLKLSAQNLPTDLEVSSAGTVGNIRLSSVIISDLTVEVGDTITLPYGENAYVQNSGTNKNVILKFGIPTGNGVTKVELIKIEGLVKTYRMYFANGTTFDYQVTDGSGTTTSWGAITGNVQNQTDLINLLNTKVTKNNDIVGATRTKITYDSKGLVTNGADLEESDIPSLHLAKISDITATASELNVLDGITATTAELNYVDGVTSNIQVQLNTITQNLTTESQTRSQADTALGQRIDTEESARQEADETLQANIDNEESARSQADTTLQTNINSEAQTRSQADITLGQRIDTLNESLTEEAETRQEADTTLQTNIEAEATARSQADTTLQTNIEAEATARSQADTTLQTNINTKVTKNSDIVSGTHSKITYDSKGLVTDGSDLTLSDLGITASATELNYTDGVTSNIQTQLDNKVVKNNNITGATHSKITYDSKGLVTGGSDLTLSDLGITATASELNVLDGITATTAELNVLDGITATTTELNYVDGTTSNIQAQINSKLNTSDVINNVTTTTTNQALSANMGKELQDEIDNLKSLGRYLSTWNCATGLAGTDPTTSPYTYHTGDYFLVGTVASEGANNYRPSGSQYIIGQASTTVEAQTVNINDVYIYDGTTWKLQINSSRTVTFSSIAGQPTDNTNLASALNAKVTANNSITGATKTKITYDSKGLVTDGTDLIESDIPSLHLSKITDVTASASELNVLDGITATTAELNYISGVTSNIQTQLGNKVVKNSNIVAGTGTKITYDEKGLVTNSTNITLSDVTDVTATSSEVNVLDGITASTVELNYVDGVTSSIQTQLDSKVNKNSDIIGATHSKITYDSKGLVTGGSDLTLGDLGVTASSTELNYTDGVTSNIQTQLNSKLPNTTKYGADLSYSNSSLQLKDQDGNALGNAVTIESSPAIDDTTITKNSNDELQAVKLVGLTSTVSELNILNGVTATASELNVLDGITATTAELNYTDGVTSNIQTQLNSKLSSVPQATSSDLGGIKASTKTSAETQEVKIDSSTGKLYVAPSTNISADGTTIENVNNVITAIGVKDGQTGNADKFVTLTKTQYDALATKDANTFYNVTDEAIGVSSNLANVDLNNLTSTGKKVIDGQWVNSVNTIANEVTPTTSDVTYSLSSILPDDNYSYEILCRFERLSTASGYVAIPITTSDITSTLLFAYCDNEGWSYHWTYDINRIIVGTDRNITVKYVSWLAQTGKYSILMYAYRRIGTNS